MYNTLYQIQRADGKYAIGKLPYRYSQAAGASFTPHGKTWSSKGAFSNYLTAFVNQDKDPLLIFADCTVIVIDVENETVTKYPFPEYFVLYTANKLKNKR